MTAPEKVSPGTKVGRSPLRRADFINDLVNVVARHKQSELGGPATPVQDLTLTTDLVKVQNLTGGNCSIGEVVQLGSPLLDEIDPRNLWFEAAAPNYPLTLRTAVLREPIPTSEIGLAQVSGICPAIVNVGNTAHTHAIPAANQTILTSCMAGPVEILSPVTGTGNLTLVVRLGAEIDLLFGKFDGNITKGGTGNLTIWDTRGNSSTGQKVQIKAVGALCTAGKWGQAVYDRVGDQMNGGPWEC